MYNNEIEKLLKDNDYIIDVNQYWGICSSPQIDHIKYNGERNYSVWTVDGNNYNFSIKY